MIESIFKKKLMLTKQVHQKHVTMSFNDVAIVYVKGSERLRAQAKDKYRNLSEEDKNKNRYHNMSEEKNKG